MNKRIVLGGLAALVLVAVGWFALDSSAVEYTDIDHAQKLGSTVQVVGTWVKEDGSTYDQNRDEFSFTMRDQSGKNIPVILSGPKPNNFEIAVSVVVKGRVENGVMRAQHVLTKCPSKYEGSPQGA